MVEIPGVERPIIPAAFRDTVGWEIVIILLVTVAGIVAAIPEPPAAVAPGVAVLQEFSWQKKTTIWIVIGIGVCTLAKLFIKAKKQRHDASPHDLEGCLLTLHAILLGSSSDEGAKHGLRLTLHRPVQSGAELEQVLEYVGDERASEKCAGRRFPSQSGIIGKALREKRALIAKRTNADYQAYVAELVSVWSYTEKHARERDKAAMSWIGIPIADGDKVLGILYGDSTNPDFFDAVKLNFAILACKGIAHFVARRYK